MTLFPSGYCRLPVFLSLLAHLSYQFRTPTFRW